MNKVITTTLFVCSFYISFAQQYTFKANMPTPRSAMAAALITTNGEQPTPSIFVCGGSVSGQPSSIVEAYDVLTNTWSTKAPLLFPILEGFAATVNGKVYVIGGYSSGGAINKVQEYNPTTNIWVLKATMPTSRSQLSGAVINNKIYVVGGWPGEYNVLEIYDPATDTWTTGANLMYGLVQNNSGVNFNNELYIMGGKDYAWSNVFNYNSKYDPQANSWAAMTALPAPRFSGAAVNYNGKIHYFGGATASWTNNFNTHFLYDPALTSWTTGLQMPTKLVAHVAVVANNKVYIIGGSDSSGSYTTHTLEYSEPLLQIVDPNITIRSYLADGYLKVQAPSQEKITEMALFDLTGKRVINTLLAQNGLYVDGLPKGMYLLQVIAGKNIHRSKLIL
jgi:N-acetylneuraminic acid mutarotase